MKSKPRPQESGDLFQQDLENLLDRRQPLVQLADRLPWEALEKSFEGFYKDGGRPALPTRLMAGLLLLKQLENLSDERVCSAWQRDPYMQYFCGETYFQWKLPCEPSELVADTTVQESDIGFPTDTRLHVDCIHKLWALGEKEGVKWRRRYTRKVPELLARLRTRSNRLVKERRKARRKLKTIAGRLFRDFERSVGIVGELEHAEGLMIIDRVLKQTRHDRGKVYSLHDPEVLCIAKGKAHKKYEFGRKASIAMLRYSSVIVSAVSFEDNIYDGDTLDKALRQTEKLTGKSFDNVLVDRGYRGRKQAGSTQVEIPRKPSKKLSYYHQRKERKRYARRAAIEPVIGHLKRDFRMARCFLKGSAGSAMNLALAASAWNLKKWINELLFALLFPFAETINRFARTRNPEIRLKLEPADAF